MKQKKTAEDCVETRIVLINAARELAKIMTLESKNRNPKSNSPAISLANLNLLKAVFNHEMTILFSSVDTEEAAVELLQILREKTVAASKFANDIYKSKRFFEMISECFFKKEENEIDWK